MSYVRTRMGEGQIRREIMMGDLVVPVEQTRTSGMLGASEAAAALGFDRFTSPLTIWKRLRGEAVDEERSPALDEAARWGGLLEPIIRGKYALDRGSDVFVPRESVVRDGWLRATPDGYVCPGSKSPTVASCDTMFDGGIRGLLQVKNRHAFARDDWRDGVPTKEQIQVRVEMAVCDLPWSDVAVLIGGNQMLVHRVERDLQLEDRILTDLRAFWDLVQSGREPSPDASAAWRAHVSEKMRPTKVVITPDEDMRELVDFWLNQRRKRKMAQEEEEAAKNDILLRLSAAGAVGIDLGERGKVSAYKTGARTDWKRYSGSLVDILTLARLQAPSTDAYKTESKTWALRAPSDDGED